ncbi:MAG: hypothetical protein CO160_00750, partial [Candidatus Portnoybacteria bacterium CG_4_9_14_3_um_filter_43_11]
FLFDIYFYFGSGGGIRTHDQLITLILKFPLSVDYIIPAIMRGKALPSHNIMRSTPFQDSL